MQAVTVRDRAAGVRGLSLTEMPYPHFAEHDVIVRVHAAGFTPGELDWPATWCDLAGRDRTPSVPGHELSGVVVELGYGATGLTVGQRVFGLVDWARNGALAEYVAVAARDLAPLAADVDHTVAAALPLSGLSLAGPVRPRRTCGGPDRPDPRRGGRRRFDRGPTRARGGSPCDRHRQAAHRETALGLGADSFLDLEADRLDDVGEVDIVFDVIGGEIRDRSVGLVRASGGTLVAIAGPPLEARPRDGRAIFFVVEPDRDQLAGLAQRVRDGRLEAVVAMRTLSEAPAAFAPDRRAPDKTIIRITAD